MSGSSKNVRILVLSALLTAAAAALSVLEGFIPIYLAVPIPGLKLGLANIVTMFAIFALGYKYTFPIVAARCLLGAMFGGGPVSLLFSLSGALTAAIVMMAMKKGYGKVFSYYGISLAGSSAFNIMQVIAAALILKDTAVFSYLPLIMTGGVATGILTATVFGLFYIRMEKSGIVKRYFKTSG
jgi:heptaprenyl diphosphate synthase